MLLVTNFRKFRERERNVSISAAGRAKTVCMNSFCRDGLVEVSERLGINLEFSQYSQIIVNPYFLAQGSLWGWVDLGFDDLPASV